MYPRLRPPQRGQTKPLGHRCAVRCSPHRTSSPKRERSSLTVMMGFLFNRLGFFISDILSPFVRLFKLDIHLIFFDMDGFKRTNDSFGETKVDQVMESLRDNIVSIISKKGKLYHYFGDEFVIV